MYSVCIVMAELVNDLANPLIFLVCARFPNDPFETESSSAVCPVTMGDWAVDRLKSTLFPLVIEFVVKQTLHSGIHCQEIRPCQSMLSLSSEFPVWHSHKNIGIPVSRASRDVVSCYISKRSATEPMNYQHEEKWTKELRTYGTVNKENIRIE